MTSLVVRKVRGGGALKLKLVPVAHMVIGGGVLKLERVQVVCPACGQQVEAVAMDSRVKGYCAVAKQDMDFPIEPQRIRTGNHATAETRAKLSAATKKLWQDPEYRAKVSAALTGKHLTAEHRAKISEALRRRHRVERE